MKRMPNVQYLKPGTLLVPESLKPAAFWSKELSIFLKMLYNGDVLFDTASY